MARPFARVWNTGQILPQGGGQRDKTAAMRTSHVEASSSGVSQKSQNIHIAAMMVRWQIAHCLTFEPMADCALPALPSIRGGGIWNIHSARRYVLLRFVQAAYVGYVLTHCDSLWSMRDAMCDMPNDLCLSLVDGGYEGWRNDSNLRTSVRANECSDDRCGRVANGCGRSVRL